MANICLSTCLKHDEKMKSNEVKVSKICRAYQKYPWFTELLSNVSYEVGFHYSSC